MKPFPKVQTGYPFPELEQEVLRHWRDRDVFRRSLELNRGGAEFVFYEGPPTANNVPHVGHVVTRVVKDLIPRYRALRGDYVARKGGWDTHGLPVEIEIEKRLGFTQKAQIEEFGIAEFNALCLESVDTYEREWRLMVERVGHWIDLENPYFTYTNTYIESVWWALAELARKEKLDRGYKIQPYCGRCGTSLSSHEVAQNYKDADDPSVWALFPLRAGQTRVAIDGREHALGPAVSVVAWTTTPWTLLSHAGLAVSPKLRYRLVRHPVDAERLLLFADELERPLPLVVESSEGRTKVDLRDEDPIARFDGESLAGLLYDRPFRVALPDGADDEGPGDESGWRVFTADYVNATEGTGIVHTAPLFGEDDYQSGLAHGLPGIQAVTEGGKIADLPGLEDFSGQWFKDADPIVLRRLKAEGRLLHTETYRHSYPFCWRCDQPLLYYATPGWFIRTTEAKEALIRKNREIDWHPAHIGEGRFGDWLENVVDWAVSRNRYWGTPLPIWVCAACDHRQVIGSYAELFAACGETPPVDLYDRKSFDPHRPGIDGFRWPCDQCDGTMHRVEEVIDAWFDSGSMPFAQLHYPFENREVFKKRFPADFISEAVDQTRGWFYTLHALAVLLFDDVAYKHCVVLGHVNDETGRKMSKRLGNVVDPMQVIDESGADALRWYFYLNNPELPARFSARLVREAAQNFLLPLWNALSFFTIYANLDGWRPGTRPEPDFETRPALDRWILLRLNRLIADTETALDGYRIADSARGLETFVGELTNWYIRRSRDRFWSAEGTDDDDKASAYEALYEVLSTLARLLAPFTPFVAEMLWTHLVRSQDDTAIDSVHLSGWPEVREGLDDEGLEEAIGVVQRIVRLGHAARNTHGIKTRQPLMKVHLDLTDRSLRDLVVAYEDQILAELNVKGISYSSPRKAFVQQEVLPIFPKLGPRFGKAMPKIKAALAAEDGDKLATALNKDGRMQLELDGETIEIRSEEVEIRLSERQGVAAQVDRDLLVALDIELTPELITEGLAREVVNRLQTARKDADLDYADRIGVVYRAAPELEKAIAAHSDWIAGETLARSIAPTDAPQGLTEAPIEDHDFAFRIEKV